MRLDNRNKILLGGFLAVLLLSYHMAIKKTLLLRKEFHIGMDNATFARDIPLELADLSKKEKHLDVKFQQFNMGTSSQQNELLKFLGSEAQGHGVKILDFGAPHLYQIGNAMYKTHIFNLEGSFKGILHVAHALENLGTFGAISHMAFEKEKDYRSKKTFLRATIHLEQVQ